MGPRDVVDKSRLLITLSEASIYTIEWYISEWVVLYKLKEKLNQFPRYL